MKHLILLLFIASPIFHIKAQSLDIPLVTVEGESIMFVQPDEVLLQFIIAKRAGVLSEARSKNEAISQAAFSFLKSKGLPNKHIQTTHMHIGPRLGKDRKVEHFEATQTFHICLNNIELYDEIVDGLIGLGIYRIGNPTFKTTKMKAAKEKARQEAIQDAKTKATLLATELGQTIGKAKLIEDVNAQHGQNTGAYSSGSDFGGTGSSNNLSFAPGQIQIHSRIKVSFQLNNF